MVGSFEVATDPTSQDVGGLIHLEYVKLEVPDLEIARLFYAEGLGLTADPGTLASDRGRPQVVWYNIGRQQFHIVKRGVQRTPGFVELVLPDLDIVEEQLHDVRPLLAGTDFWFDRVADKADGSDELLVRDPWGQRFTIHKPSPAFPFKMGISGLNLPCRMGLSHDIGIFYKFMFNARVQFVDDELCIVQAGPGCQLIFVEDPDVSDHQIAYEGCQLGVYVGNFSEAFQAIESAGLVLADFDYRELSASMEAALEKREFQFQDIVVLRGPPAAANGNSDNGVLPSRTQLYRLHHEVKSLYHPRFMRPLFNRALGGFDY
eukprot:jgi/Botrbrau1/7413/Bobra.0112s0013.1